MANTDGLLLKDGQWWTCGCGGTPKKAVQVPQESIAIYVKLATKVNGPETGIEYSFLPHQNSIDVDSKDAESWLKDGTALPVRAGYKGRLARTGKVNAKKT